MLTRDFKTWWRKTVTSWRGAAGAPPPCSPSKPADAKAEASHHSTKTRPRARLGPILGSASAAETPSRELPAACGLGAALFLSPPPRRLPARRRPRAAPGRQARRGVLRRGGELVELLDLRLHLRHLTRRATRGGKQPPCCGRRAWPLPCTSQGAASRPAPRAPGRPQPPAETAGGAGRALPPRPPPPSRPFLFTFFHPQPGPSSRWSLPLAPASQPTAAACDGHQGDLRPRERHGPEARYGCIGAPRASTGLA